MEQIQISETFKKNNAATTGAFIVIMSVIFLMAFLTSVFPVTITIMFLITPAIIMNLGWILFAGAI